MSDARCETAAGIDHATLAAIIDEIERFTGERKIALQLDHGTSRAARDRRDKQGHQLSAFIGMARWLAKCAAQGEIVSMGHGDNLQPGTRNGSHRRYR